MEDINKTKDQLISELVELRSRYEELERKVKEYKSVETDLKKSEERFQQIAENAVEWIWEVDKDGLYTYSNSVVEKILGYKPEEIINKKHFYDLFHPDTRDDLKKVAFEIFSRREAFRNFINVNLHKKGTLVYLETNGLPVINEKGDLIGYRGYLIFTLYPSESWWIE